MIKMVKYPKDKTIKCKTCKTKFSYSADDIDWWIGISEGFVKCPTCKRESRAK